MWFFACGTHDESYLTWALLPFRFFEIVLVKF